MFTENCPVCGDSNNFSSVARSDLIAMQNYVYQSRDEALTAQTGRFDLHTCCNCGFAYNAAFDASLLKYDENYNNNVPSSIFSDYYKKIASFVYKEFSLENGLVFDVGCGKGAFLRTLCSMYPDVYGLGVDPSYEPDDSARSIPNVSFVKDVFRTEHITRKPSLVICRHVLEHIERPMPFLKSIYSAVKTYPETPFFVEVPDLEWIIENNAFWDFCYEHCNYFTKDSLSHTLKSAGFEPHYVRKEFNGQYLWAIGKVGRIKSETPQDKIGSALSSYSANETDLMSKSRHRLEGLKQDGRMLAVWGMATKGVIFCNLIDPQSVLFDYCIDINSSKANCFVPHTGHQIKPPEALAKTVSSALVVVVMNPNYVIEISETCLDMNLSPMFIDAYGNELIR